MGLNAVTNQLEIVNKQMTVQIMLQAKMLAKMGNTTKAVKAQSKTIEDTAKSYFSLSDAQKVATDTTDSFTRRFAKAANSVDGAGKTWTMFSRILSGSPLWKMQNYVRSVGQAMDMFQTNTEKSVEAANEQAEAMGKLTEQIDGVDRHSTLLKDSKSHKELLEYQKLKDDISKGLKLIDEA